jgi:hypothetical protein
VLEESQETGQPLESTMLDCRWAAASQMVRLPRIPQRREMYNRNHAVLSRTGEGANA